MDHTFFGSFIKLGIDLIEQSCFIRGRQIGLHLFGKGLEGALDIVVARLSLLVGLHPFTWCGMLWHFFPLCYQVGIII